MYILPNATDFNNACASVDRTIATKCEVISGGVTTTMVGDGINGEIISMEWDNIVCSNDGLQIGTTCMDEFKMTYRPVTTTMSLMGKEIHPYVGLEFGSPATVTYVPLGVFYVTDSSTEDDGYTVNITAYDGMQKFMKDFNATTIGVTFPCKAWELLEAIATYFGVTLTYDAIVYALLSSDDYYLYTSDDYRLVVSDKIDRNKHASLPEAYEGTYRDYIGWIVGLVGAYAHMGRNGDLVVSQYKDHGFEVGRNVQHMGGAKINYGGAVTYTSIVSGTEENPIYPTYYGGNAITYTNPFITQSELDYLCEGLLQVDGITVTPCDVAWRSNPCVDAGDIVSVVDKDGNNLSVYVMERVVRITGGLAEELHCYGETETAHTLNKSPLVTSFNNKINEAIKTASDYINNTKGVFEWIDNGDGTNGGFTIYETDDDKSWLRCTAGGIGISADGGLTYTNAITKNGVVASQLNVTADGHTILEAKLAYSGLGYENPYIKFRNAQGKQAFNVDYNDYFKSTSIVINDAYLGTDKATAFMSVGRSGTPPDNFVGGSARIRLADPRDGHLDGVSMYTDYPDNGYANSGIALYTDIVGEHNFGRASMGVSVYESNGVVHDRASMGLYDRLTANERIAFCDDNDDPYIRVHQGTTWRNLRPIRLSINGTYYWLLAEQG